MSRDVYKHYIERAQETCPFLQAEAKRRLSNDEPSAKGHSECLKMNFLVILRWVSSAYQSDTPSSPRLI